MLGSQDRWQEDIFVACPLRDLIPEDHVLRRVDRVLDLAWLREEVADCYSDSLGRPSIDPEAAVRLMLAGFFQGITHDRHLMREAQVNLAIRWFAGYRLHDRLPDHSSLTRIRQRWGPERFRRIFERTVRRCVEVGLVTGETLHVDATLIRADASWQSFVAVHADRVLRDNAGEEAPQDPPPPRRGRPRKNPPKVKKRSTTDPEATLAAPNPLRVPEPSYKEHVAVDSRSGVVVDVHVTTGEVSEGDELTAQIERAETLMGKRPAAVSADGGYGKATVFAWMEDHTIHTVIPPRQPKSKPTRIPLCRFRYDAKHGLVRCPRGRKMHRSTRVDDGWFYSARAHDCRRCPLRSRCVTAGASAKAVLITDGYEALLRARRRFARWSPEERAIYERHRWQVEGRHAEAKHRHGLRRAVRRGLAQVAIQGYLTAAVMNLKRLAALIRLQMARVWRLWGRAGSHAGNLRPPHGAFSAAAIPNRHLALAA